MREDGLRWLKDESGWFGGFWGFWGPLRVEIGRMSAFGVQEELMVVCEI